MHPQLKSQISFYSNGLAILHGLPKNGYVKVNNDRQAAILNLIIFFQDASSLVISHFVL